MVDGIVDGNGGNPAAGNTATALPGPGSRRRGGGAPALLLAASFVVVVAGLRAAADLLLPVLAALFLSILSLPLLAWFRRRRVPSPLAVVLTMAVAILLIGGIGGLIGGSVGQFVGAAPVYQERLNALAGRFASWLQGHGLDTSRIFDPSHFDAGMVMNFISGTLNGIVSLVSNAVLVLLTMAFILAEAVGFPEKISSAFGADPAIAERTRRIVREVQRYLAMKTLVSLATGALVAAWLAVLGVDFALLWGLVAFLFNYIPNLGSILAGIPAVLLSLVQFGIGRTIAVIAGYVVVNFVLGNLVEPWLLGRRLGLSTLVVFLSLLFWGWVWGPLGMLLSVPLTVIVKIMLENTDDLRWVAVLLDAAPAPRGKENAAR